MDGLTNKEAAKILGVKPDQVHKLRIMCGLSTISMLSRQHVALMEDYIMKLKPFEDEAVNTECIGDLEPDDEPDEVDEEEHTAGPSFDEHCANVVRQALAHEPCLNPPHIDSVPNISKKPDDFIVTVSLGDLRELIRRIKPQRMGVEELLDAV